ncbi:MAG: D-alanyl-D-alanine carboxypeptidase [Acidobacteriota bacterium]|nr:D-alanyl-D-alanine carboxypeptidase [Acidobacteriota bacterium]
MKTKVLNIFGGALLLFAMLGNVSAQTQTQQPIVPLPSPSPAAAQQNLAQSEVAPIYGLQGVLIETPDGKSVSAQAVDQPLNPASAIKLGTALVALQNFGPHHRFTTGFWTNGSFDKQTGEIQGNLYVTGRDPSFHYEHAVMVARQLNSLGIRRVTGDLVVAPGFTMNFSASARRSGEILYDTLDATLRSSVATRAWIYERTALGDHSSLQTVPTVAVMGDVLVGSVAPGARILMGQKSSKLTDVLKVLLCYSNNFMAERIGDSLGGTESVRRQLMTRLGIPPYEIELASLSGLGVNRVTPRAMMKIFRALRIELQKHRLLLSEIMPVAGIDPGTLEDRFTGPSWQGSVIAKTGTLIRTDGGASSLVGQMRTARGEVLLFVIMNQGGNVLRFRTNQDYLVMQVQNSRGGPKAFNYKPLTLTMKLSDTENISGAATNEFEPNLTSTP